MSAVAAAVEGRVVSFDHNDVRVLAALADANDQFHWGRKPEELDDAGRRLIVAGVNAALAEALQAKAARMRTIKGLRLTSRSRGPRRSRSCCVRLPVPRTATS
jgi:hypothetical protein